MSVVRSTLLLTLLAFIAPPGCQPPNDLASAPARTLLRDSPGRWMVRTELFFGLSRPDGGMVAEDEWQAFVRDELTPRFPAGLTTVDARGQWLDTSGAGVQREPSRLVVILHESDRAADERIERVRDAYKRRFNQQSVMRVDSLEKVSF